MKRLKTISLITSLILPVSILAQPVQGFDELSTGNKMIARSLMDAQTLPADGTGEFLTLDQIAYAKGETGWSNVFKQMQAEGLIDAKNLGEVVSAHAHMKHQPITSDIAIEAGMSTDTAIEENNTADTTSSDASTDVTGSFEQLSAGNQKIVRSLMDAQTLPGDGTGEFLTLDQIAYAKGETGWGNVFKQMQAEGLVDAKNLGQVVSEYHTGAYSVSSDTSGLSTVAATSASDHSSDKAKGNANGHIDRGVVTAANNNSTANITTAAGINNGNGNAYGLTKVSANNNITTGNGAAMGSSVAVNAASSSTAVSSAAHTGGSINGQGNAYGRNK